MQIHDSCVLQYSSAARDNIPTELWHTTYYKPSAKDAIFEPNFKTAGIVMLGWKLHTATSDVTCLLLFSIKVIAIAVHKLIRKQYTQAIKACQPPQ
jgi:hypothetical protein